MNYCLQADETLEQGIKRVVKEELMMASQALHSSDKIHKGVHLARKSLKKVRGVLRLIKDEIGKQRYIEENVFFRDTARLLSGIRDTEAIIEALDTFSGRFPEVIEEAFAEDLIRQLKLRRDDLVQKALARENVVQVARERVEYGYAHADELPIASKGFKAIAPGFKRIYLRGYTGFHRTYHELNMENVHEWRKHVKYHWHHMLLLESLWPEVLHDINLELRKLSSYLGDWRDMDLLKDALKEERIDIPPRTAKKIFKYSKSFQKELIGEAFRLGSKLYAERATSITDRIEQYWRVRNQ